MPRKTTHNNNCNDCGILLNDKNWLKHDKKRHYYICSRCKSIRANKYNKKNKEKHRINQWKYHLLKTYGITVEERENILKSQGYKCAICGKLQEDEKKRFAIDHNHKTKHIRGVLCGYCNGSLLRYLRDNKNRAIGLIRYLTKAIAEDKKWEV